MSAQGVSCPDSSLGPVDRMPADDVDEPDQHSRWREYVRIASTGDHSVSRSGRYRGPLESPAASPVDYCPLWLLMASSTFFLIASRLNEAGSCIGGNSMAVAASFPTYSCTITKRQNSRA